MKLEHRLVKGIEGQTVAVVELDGSVNSTTALEIDEILTAIQKQNHGPIVVDLTKVSYISSAGWRVFLGRTRGDGERLKITGMQQTVRDVFELLGLGSVIEAFDTVESAIFASASEVG